MPQLKQSIRKGQRLAQLPGALLAKRAAFNCPICSYTGPFLDTGPTCWMFNDQCLWCGALSRHRIQYCALEEFFLTYDCRGKAAIHFAPEPQFSRDIRPSFAIYHTADLNPQQVDFRADLRDLPFGDRSYDFVYASHVLEHIDDDQRALSEIRRVLRPGGVAILPVPIIGTKTVEYPYPSPVEAFHVRAPGVDYFDRYAAAFNRVELKSSQDYPASFQLYIYETQRVIFAGSHAISASRRRIQTSRLCPDLSTLNFAKDCNEALSQDLPLRSDLFVALEPQSRQYSKGIFRSR